MARKSNISVIELGDVRYSGVFLRNVTEEEALKHYPHLDRNQVKNAWKQANGKTVRNYTKKTKKVKEKPKENKDGE
jgi:hypothetical protein